MTYLNGFTKLISDLTGRAVFAVLFLSGLTVLGKGAGAYSGLAIQTNVPYGKAAGQSLLLDIYMPPTNFARPLPAILEVHGGGWEGGDKGSVLDVIYCKDLAAAGFAVFSIDYRLVVRPQNGGPAKNCYPIPFDDCQRAVRWVRRFAPLYDIDPSRLGAIGGSAGGNLVSLLGTKETRDNAATELASYSSRVDAVVDIAGPADLTRPFPTNDLNGMTVQKMVDNFAGHSLREASPIFAIDSRTPPFLILQGGADTLVPPEQGRIFADALKKAERDVAYIEIPDEWHVFLKPKSQELAKKKIIEFFQRTLAKK
jgi:acetyl esterase/lipase